jgi:4-hydroxy-tetrahydrodipicolinate reductase
MATMENQIKVGIVGCAGRMGQMLVTHFNATDGCVIAGATEHAGHAVIGQDVGVIAGLGPLGVIVGDDAAHMIAVVDAVVDFTIPEATLEHARLAAQAGAAIVIGTTGISDEQGEELARAARHVPVVWAPNMSVGVTLLLALTEQVARVLDDSFDIEILEMHHRHKVDSPSGTALGLGHAAAAGRNSELRDVKQAVRDGHTGERPVGEIGFATLRGGDVVGDHTVIFAGDGERIELSHKAASRKVFAAGAVRATQWTIGAGPGLYSMRHVLGFES